nr:hypothetical protein [Dyella sp. ASV24]
MAFEKWAHHVLAYLVCGGAFLWGFVALGGYGVGRSAFYALLVLAGWHVIVLLQDIARSIKNADATSGAHPSRR